MFKRAQVVIDDDDLHAVVSICSIFLLIVAICSTVARLLTKFAVVHKLAFDDYMFIPALVSSMR